MSQPASLPPPTVLSPSSGAVVAAGAAKLFVRCDVEGASGVVSPEQVDGTEQAFGRRMLMADLKALIEGLRQGGASEVLVYDGHGDGINVDPGELPPGVMLISGRPPYRADWRGGLDDSFAGLILLGAHAAAGTETALLPHTYAPDILGLRVNGRELGEIGVEAAVAGDAGVPLLMVTGDAAAVAEGSAVAPQALGVVVKDAVDRRGALCYALAVTTDLIRRAAQQLAKEPPRAAPFRIESPTTLEVDLAAGELLERMRELFPRDVKGESRIRIRAGSVTEAWAGFHGRWMRAVRRL
jgi:D-amino peptidase